MVHVAAAFNIPLLGLYSGLDDFYDKFFSACDHKIIIRATKGDYGIKSIEYNQVKAGLIETLTLLQENKS
jgi:ADP-heptose:LPS heptosyltransferase